MEKFKTIEEAQKAFDAQEAVLNEQADKVKSLEAALVKEKKRADDAEEAAKDAVEAYNSVDNNESDVTVKVGKSTYRVNFGVDGKTKEQVKDDGELVKRLLKINSGALTQIKV